VTKAAFFFLILLAAAGTGCIRLQAGTWYKGAEDETAKVHEVALDTSRLVNRDAYQPQVTMPDS